MGPSKRGCCIWYIFDLGDRGGFANEYYDKHIERMGADGPV